jgi:hypothetical protein
MINNSRRVLTTSFKCLSRSFSVNKQLGAVVKEYEKSQFKESRTGRRLDIDRGDSDDPFYTRAKEQYNRDIDHDKEDLEKAAKYGRGSGKTVVTGLNQPPIHEDKEAKFERQVDKSASRNLMSNLSRDESIRTKDPGWREAEAEDYTATAFEKDMHKSNTLSGRDSVESEKTIDYNRAMRDENMNLTQNPSVNPMGEEQTHVTTQKYWDKTKTTTSTNDSSPSSFDSFGTVNTSPTADGRLDQLRRDMANVEERLRAAESSVRSNRDTNETPAEARVRREEAAVSRPVGRVTQE